MSGHSHWATIKRAKGAADAKKGKIFSKLGKEITIVVKAKGGNPDNNPTLRTLIAKAKAAQMPNDNIERAIKKGTGELESAEMVDCQYEGIKNGTAVVVRVLTDNKNRAAAEVGSVFTKSVSLYVNYYDKEPAFEYIQILKDLCQAAEIGVIEKVEKAYGEIKQALLKGEKIVEIRL